MEKTVNIDKVITDFIYLKPEVVAKILKANGYSLPLKLTLPIITETTFKAIYNDVNKKFISELEANIYSEDHSNFAIVPLAISAGVSVFSSLLGSKQAKKALEVQEKIAFATLAQTRLLEEEKIRTGAETERTKILLNTLQQYQSDLQKQSTQRIKDVWIYTGMLAVGVAIIYGTAILLKPNTN